MSKKRKATDSLPRWAHLLLFHPDDDDDDDDDDIAVDNASSNVQNSSIRDSIGTGRRRRKSSIQPQPPTTMATAIGTATATTRTIVELSMKKIHSNSLSQSSSLLPPISYEREDLYLRVEAYRYASALMDTILHESMMHVFVNQPVSLRLNTNSNHNPATSSSLLESWIDFIQKFNPPNADEEHVGKHDKDEYSCGVVDSHYHHNMPQSNTDTIPTTATTTASTYTETGTVDPIFNKKFIHHSYHPTLLPIVIFNFSSLGLDRSCIMPFLSSQYTKQMASVDIIDDPSTDSSHVRKPAVCILQYRSGCTLKSLLREILRQCVAQEEPRVQDTFQYLLQKDRRALSKKQQNIKDSKGIQRQASYRHKILHWAQMTDSSHSIVVILENPEIIPLEILNNLITTMSHLRYYDLVPIGLVLCSISYDSSRWRSLECFTGNIVVQDIHVPPSIDILNYFLHRLYHLPQGKDDTNYPILPSKEVLENLRSQFNDYHGSIISFLHLMKSALAHHFARKGSFLAMTDESSFTKYHGKRIAWFCFDPKARSYLMSTVVSSIDETSSNIPSSTLLTLMDTAIQDKQFLYLIIRVIHFSHNFLAQKSYISRTDLHSSINFVHPLNAVEACICSSDEYRKRVKDVLEKLCALQLSELVIFMIQCARFIQMFLIQDDRTRVSSLSFTKYIEDCIFCDSDTRKFSSGILRDPKDRLKRLLHWVNENIILIDTLLQAISEECIGVHIMSKEQIISLEISLRQDILATFGNLFHRISFDWCISSPFSILMSLADKRSNALVCEASFLQSILAQPRRHVALGVREKLSSALDARFLGNDVRIAFSVLNVRVIDLITWFSRFSNDIHQEDNQLISDHSFLLQRFSFAVHQLIHMGIVSKSRRSDDVYEKLAMVWVS